MTVNGALSMIRVAVMMIIVVVGHDDFSGEVFNRSQAALIRI
jgi:hypothetical protein